MKRIDRISLAGLAILLPLIILSCGKNGAEQKRPQVVKKVAIGSVKVRPLDHVIPVTATLEPVSSAEIGVKTQGRVAKLGADEGDRVSRGQLLAQLSSPSLAYQNAEAAAMATASDAALESAEADLKQKRRDYERMALAGKKGIISGSAVEQARADLEMAEAEFRNMARRRDAESAAAGAMTAQTSELALTSPIDGIVSRRMLEPGQVVSPGFIAFRVVDLRKLKAVAYVAEEVLPGFKVGQQVLIEIESLGDTVPGKVSAVVRELDPTTRMAKVEAIVENSAQKFASGMRALIRVTIAKHESATVIPSSAVLTREDGDYVFVVEDGKAVQRKIELAFRNDPWVAVASGLKADEKIVTGQLGGLRGGTSVSPLE